MLQKETPIIFLVHSLGGIIVKDVRTWSLLLQALVGL